MKRLERSHCIVRAIASKPSTDKAELMPSGAEPFPSGTKLMLGDAERFLDKAELMPGGAERLPGGTKLMLGGAEWLPDGAE